MPPALRSGDQHLLSTHQVGPSLVAPGAMQSIRMPAQGCSWPLAQPAGFAHPWGGEQVFPGRSSHLELSRGRGGRERLGPLGLQKEGAAEGRLMDIRGSSAGDPPPPHAPQLPGTQVGPGACKALLPRLGRSSPGKFRTGEVDPETSISAFPEDTFIPRSPGEAVGPSDSGE